MTDFAVTHRTTYSYSSGVALCHNEARLLPLRTDWQRCGESHISIHPKPSLYAERQDFFGNRVLYFVIQDIHQGLDVVVKTRVRVGKRPDLPAAVKEPWENSLRALRGDSSPAGLLARQFALDSPFISGNAALRDYALPSFPAGRSIVEAMIDLNRRIHEDFTYDPNFTTLATPLSEVLSNRRGVCQDFAHLAIGCLRSLGVAARYVSGYLETAPPPGKPRLVGADASHAWLAVFLPEHGWAEFDPTNNCLADERHVILACGRDYGDVAPLKGVMSGGGPHSLKVSVDVAPLPATEVKLDEEFSAALVIEELPPRSPWDRR